MQGKSDLLKWFSKQKTIINKTLIELLPVFINFYIHYICFIFDWNFFYKQQLTYSYKQTKIMIFDIY